MNKKTIFGIIGLLWTGMQVIDTCMNMESSYKGVIIVFNHSSSLVGVTYHDFDDVKSACKTNGIQVLRADDMETITVKVVDRPDEIIDLSPFLHHKRGYVFKTDGKEAVFHKYDKPYVILNKATRYFGVSVP